MKRISRKRSVVTLLSTGSLIQLLGAARGLIITPLAISYLGAQSYGIWLASGGILAWISMLDLGLANLTIQRVTTAIGQQDKRLAADYFASSITISTAAACVATAIFWYITPLIAFGLGVDITEHADFVLAIRIAIIGLSIGFVADALGAFSIAIQRPLGVKLGAALGRIVSIVVSSYLLSNRYGVASIPMGILARNCVCLTFGLFYAIRHLNILAARPRPRLQQIRELSSLGPAFVLNRITNQVGSKLEVTILALIISPTAATIYSTTKMAGDMVTMILSMVRNSLYAPLCHYFGEKDHSSHKTMLRLSFGAFSLIAIVGFSFYALFNKSFVSLWVGKDMFAGEATSLLLALAFLFFNIRMFFGNSLTSRGSIWLPSITGIAEVCLRLGLGAFLLKTLGTSGLPAAVAASSIISIIILAFSLAKSTASSVRQLFLPSVIYLRLMAGVLMFLTIIPFFGLGAKSWLHFGITVGITGTLLSVLLLVLGLNYWRPILKTRIFRDS